ncbi:PadR family transcriptional regulator [Longispora albida]|uniref:PadR family transcriptional regulator n=1 Tax=Longispora albida TaxID=203523 RepID=UPI00036C87BB|nr:PadR family transcriptional regulator [Longispora albida]
MRQPRDLNATSAAVLGLLHRIDSATAGELAREAEEQISPFWGITRSQIFRELPVLAQRGLVGSGRRGARGSVPYSLTPTGRQAFGEWLTGPPFPQQPRNELLLRVGFGRYINGEELTSLLDKHRAAHAERLAQYESALEQMRAQGLEPYRIVTCEYGVRYERMVLAWIDDLPSLLVPA